MIFIIFTLVACSRSTDKSFQHKKNAEKLSLKQRGLILADAKDDIAIIQSAQTDWQVLKPAVAGRALDTLKKQIEDFKAEDLVKVRDYSDLKLTFSSYEKKVASITAEFIDNSQLVKIDNNEVMDVARAEKRKLYLGLAKVDGKWKIITILTGIKDAK